VKLVASVRSLSSRWVAWAFAAAYLVVSAAIGAALLAMPKTSDVDVGSQTTYMSDDTTQSPSTDVMTSAAPPGFQRVRGPEGLRTVIPDGWQTVNAGGPGALRAVDPSDAGRIVGFGGAKVTTTDLVTMHVEYEDRFADRTTNYRRVDLNRATYGGHPAVEWEFLHDDGRGTQRVHALYWLVDGTEYFVFVSGPDEHWARMKPVYDAMVANSRP
jgi:hypothetical protein